MYKEREKNNLPYHKFTTWKKYELCSLENDINIFIL